MSNGDSPDGFVFPPFIPPARRVQAPSTPPAPAPAAELPAAPQSGAAARPAMPWDSATPIVRDAPSAAPPPAFDDAADDDLGEDDDLPWLEPPADAAPAFDAPSAPATQDALPDWLAWDDRDTDDARSEARGVAPVEGLEDFAPADGFGAAAADFAPAASDPADTSAWSLDAPEAVEPPPVAEPAPEITFDAPAADEPAFDVTLDRGALAFAAAEPEPPAEAAAEPDPFTAASVHEAEATIPADPPAAAPAADGVFAEVAARLEDIARTLRERPDALLSGTAHDPLALLVAGYVMGYNARR